jgi:predicted regulator of Ras-like GTPase activity (Roadblock/LC7/MglB family)
MDAASALADLTEISSQVESAVVLGENGSVLASTLVDDEVAERIGRAGVDLLSGAREHVPAEARELIQVEAALREGSLFVLRGDGRTIVATTSASPSSGLVFYDLKTCLRALAQGEDPAPKPKRKPARKDQANA